MLRVLFAVLVVEVASFPVRRVESARAPLLGGVRDGIYVAEVTLAGQEVQLVVDTGSPWLGMVQRGCVTFESNTPCPTPPSGLVDLSSFHASTCSDLPLCCTADGQACSTTLRYLDGTQAVGNLYAGRTGLGNTTSFCKEELSSILARSCSHRAQWSGSQRRRAASPRRSPTAFWA